MLRGAFIVILLGGAGVEGIRFLNTCDLTALGHTAVCLLGLWVLGDR